jgi:hypothetical protein
MAILSYVWRCLDASVEARRGRSSRVLMEHSQRLIFSWSAVYRPAWDATPAAYVEHGIVGWGRSRRLVKIEDPACTFTSFVGIQHFDPSRWHLDGAPVAKVFASFFVGGRTVGLHTYATMDEALAAVREFHSRLSHE